ncbi:hypothetical protein WR25_18118 [Diploscapter pachys]|uniref:Glutamyl-tRNA(Gln) amidotransferase subunit C, mitochondrial n=1 Tax=Diploscapter pachys TaxID=2018661 RepID=A0A2A2J3Q3_9BILA|nr:hypothetical protein WR25_18118 [Diploscapter pachys]
MFRSLRLIHRLQLQLQCRQASGSGAGSKKTPFPGDDILVPDEPITRAVNDPELDKVPEFSSSLLTHLERLSLVRFSDEQAVASLRESIRIANRLKLVHVEGVEPMHTVWEDQECRLHEDSPEEPLSVEQTLGNAALVQDEYFVTPPGNIPLEHSTAPLDLQLINQWDSRGVARPEKPKHRKRENKSD